MRNGDTDAHHLLCRVGSRVCAIPLSSVSETMRPLPIEPLAGMPAFVLGLAIIRGAPTPVVDAGRLVGVTDFRATRFVTMTVGDRPVALAVEAVLGIRAWPAAAFAALPPLLREAGADRIAAIGALDTDLLLLLETARVVPDAAWRVIDGSGAAP